MDLATISAIRAELESELRGRKFGKIFQLSKFEIAVDLRLRGSRYLFISIGPANPRIYLIERRLRDLEKASLSLGQMTLLLRKHLSGAVVEDVEQLPNERVLLIRLRGENEAGENEMFTIVAQLTGASANLFLLDRNSTILFSARQTRGSGQQPGDRYAPPERVSSGGDTRRERETTTSTAPLSAVASGDILSATLDEADLRQKEDNRFRSIANSARARLKREIARREKLIEKLKADLTAHGNAERWKRLGDLLLANAPSARRDHGRVFLTDFFESDAPEIAVEIDENDSLTQAAEKFFKKYSKARNARVEIETRLKAIGEELKKLAIERELLEAAIEEHDIERISELFGATGDRAKPEKNRPGVASGTRKFFSSDGFEILVGKKSVDNDQLTFRIAKSLDTWMHAADYPGSHVVIRNPNRKTIPPATLVQAAQIAAFYSQGKSQPKAAVHYTQKKFVNKPKGAPPGLVSLASFKTILVEPKIPDEVTR